MKKLLVITFLLINSYSIFSQVLTNEEVHRIGDYGKLWGVLKLFHPALAYGNINADSLLIEHADKLLKDPSAHNFRNAVQDMLNDLHDPNTIIVTSSMNKNDSIIIPNQPHLKWFSDNVIVIHFDDDFIFNHAANFTDETGFQHLLDTLKHAKAIIFDVRRPKAINAYYDYPEISFFKRLSSYLINHDIYFPSYKTRIHYGHESQTFETPEYYQGWFTMNTFMLRKNAKAILKPLCFIVNKFSNNLAENIEALEQEGFARVLADGNLENFNAVETYPMLLADSLAIQVRLSEAVYANNCKTFIPDETVIHNNQSDEMLISKAAMLLHNSHQQLPCTAFSQNTFASQKTIANDSLPYPVVADRLWGLMNYWTEINYFCPNKDRFQKNWDSVLYEYVPLFINAKDEADYNLAVAKLITEIHDSHGWFGSAYWTNKYIMCPKFSVTYVEGKTIINNVTDDSLKKLLSRGDEILKLDAKNIDSVRNWFAQYIGASDNASLQRDIDDVILGGSIGSILNVTYKHDGVVKSVNVKRIANRMMYTYSQNTDSPPVWKKINNEIGYVDFGRLEVNQIDSMFNDFKNTTSIIIDNRSYPRGTVWTMVNYLTTKPFVTGAKGIIMIADNPDLSTETKKYALWQIPVTPKTQYKGNLIILVNEETQSQAEYSCMVLQAACRNTTIIGSETAGADGNVTGIKFPGGIETAFSGYGVLYPDGRPTQGIGIVPDIKISPTIKGIKEGKDEVLTRAIQFAETGK